MAGLVGAQAGVAVHYGCYDGGSRSLWDTELDFLISRSDAIHIVRNQLGCKLLSADKNLDFTEWRLAGNVGGEDALTMSIGCITKVISGSSVWELISPDTMIPLRNLIPLTTEFKTRE
ncbi:hypothetical protein BDQ17DRAFT_1429057 [Cyathus striatus]|nr:hypothetical protein BDQ17DRAFT_1429057 [Cyathus striatus]